jgi:hypothetical protein
MNRNFRFVIAVLALSAGFAPSLNAATTVSLANVGLGAGNEVALNSTFEVSLDLDLTDAPGDHPGSFGGGVVLTFDPAVLSLVGFTPSGAATIVDMLPTVPMQDCAQDAIVCFVDAPDISSVGSFTFAVNSDAALGETIIGIADADDFFGSFANQLLTNQAFDPMFMGTSVFAVPAPAVAWLMTSGLAVFGLFARRRR